MDGNSNSQSSVGRDTNSAEEDGLIVVGIGTSAGGVEALETLFSRMPENTGMAFVVVQHLPSEFDTLMPQILSRKTSMPVYSIEDGITLAPNRVFVLPNGVDVSVSGNQLITKEHSTGREDLPIDFFLRSLADEFEENAIAVVLSGTGTDGTNGAQAIHSRHGMVIAQSVSSAKFNGMPRSVIASGTADVIESVEQIPETLMKYSELAKLGDSTSRARRFQNSLDSESQIRQLISKNYGIDFDHYKPGLFDRRLARRMKISKIESVSDYSEILKNDELELFGLYNDLLIGVTEFFRDSEAFAELQYRALPDLLGNAPNDDSDFRVWIAPCATGEEAYSIAILLDELIQQRGYQRSVKIFATDINQRCVQTAANGFYPSDRLENLSEERIKKYFVETDGGYTICPRIRQQVVFAKHDVLNDAPFTKLDLVCCRNLLIYFQSAAKKKALSLFNFSLKNAGILFLGPSEGTTELNSAFSTVNEKWRIYRKLNPLRFSEVAGPINLGQRHVPVLMQNKRMDSNLEKRSFEIYDELLKQYMPPGLLINEHHEIEHIFGDASKFLRYDHGRPTKNLIDLLPNGFGVVVRNGLKRVKLDKKHVVYPGVDHTGSQGAQTYRICVKPVTTKIAPRFLVTIEEDQQLSDLNPLHSIRQNSEGCSEDMLGLLEEELRETRESLNDSILNLKSANEEMQTTNEELIASNEELQSTNEELHSVNEELYTVNAEHQRKIGELTELTSDMDNLLDSIQVDTIYLDRDLRVRKFTLGIANNFKLLPQDLGRQFSSFNHNLKIRNLAECVHSVIETETLFEKEVQDKRGNWYLMRILPYSSRDSISGVLITLVGINNLKQTQEKLKELSEIVSCSGDAIFRVTLEGKILTWNAGAEEIFGLKQTEAIGCNICNLLPDQNCQTQIRDTLKAVSENTEIGKLELTFGTFGDKKQTYESLVSPIHGANHQVNGVGFILRDVTERKKAQTDVKREVDRRDQFLAVLSHELRNPVAAITNSFSILSHPKCMPNHFKKASDNIHDNIRHLSKLLDDLLHVSRVTHNKLRLETQNVDLKICLEKVIESLQFEIDAKCQKLKTDLPDQLVVRCDPTRITQAITNLVHNANKYTEENGVICVSLKRMGTMAMVEVKDTGDGISPSLSDKIFEVFVQTEQSLDRSEGGMGLGLPLVKMIAEAHGGSVSFHSSGEGLGSSFQFAIPVGELEPEAAATDPASSDCLAGEKILLIEDNSGIREMLAEYLELEDAEVLQAENGLSGVDVYQQQAPRICLVDIGLPDLNGYDVARRIRKMNHQPELLVALTGYGQDQDRQKVMEAGFDIHLVKPIEPEDLIAELVSVLERNQDATNKNHSSKFSESTKKLSS